MSILNNKSFLYDEDEEKEVKPYTVPSLITSKPEVIPIYKSFLISTALHPAVVGLILLLTFIFALLGIHLFEYGKLKPTPKRDIEFVLVDKPGVPRNPNTKNRADINSRSGGINDPKRKVSMPSPSPKKAQKPSASANRANQMIKKQQQQLKKQVQNKNNASPQPKASQVAKSIQQPSNINKPSPAKPAPPNARPSVSPVSAPTPVAKPSSPFVAPIPKGAPVGKTLSTGPIGGTGSTTGGAKSGGSTSSTVKGSGGYAPRPTLSPSSGGGSGQLARGSSGGGTGNVGNPGGGGGAPGIDALREPDFGPYMRELQRRIKLNWDPPKGNESKTVVLLFRIAKDGRLLTCRVNRSSGLPSADQAALKAVELTAPFRPLPADFKGQNIDIQFTFDYRVFGASRY
ncbi:MAG: TonB C-terminal domain-containing protein [bacterium]|nr:TonB C-terminal domain-containing protein [bacterium]